jgi:hypothetical protein
VAGTRTLRRALAEQRREIERLEAELHRTTIERIIDIEVAAGVKTEKQRSQELLQMADPRKYSLEALECLRSSLLAMAARLNHASEGSGASQEQNHPRVGYIQ